MKRPIIIDCDPGTDDAAAIMLVQASGLFDICGITAVHGNVPLNRTAANALFLSELYGIGCPVAKGAERAMVVSYPRAENIHGASGLGDFKFQLPQVPFYKKPAWELIFETAAAFGGALELFAIGPLTNIAIAVLKYPELAKMIRKITVMGGGSHAGNATPYAEYNIWQDPHAASVVLNAGFRDVTLVDLDCCYSGYLTDDECDRMLLLKNRLAPLYESMRVFQRKLSHKMAEEQGSEEFQKDRNVYCDAVAAAVMIDPEIAVLEPYYVVVETESGKNCGQTVVDWNSRFNQRPNLQLARGVDREAFVRMFFASFDYYNDSIASVLGVDGDECE